MEALHSTYRSWLKICLADSIAANPSYSLRAMARDLGVSVSLLSDVLKGKKNFSVERALAVAQALKFTEQQTEIFTTLVQLEVAKTPEMKVALTDKLEILRGRPGVRDLNLDLFKMISDWYHLAILELTNVHSVKFETIEIAKSLGISNAEATAALERLERLELIEKDLRGRYSKTTVNLLASSKLPNSALRKYHQQMLDKASKALVEQTPAERFVGSETFAFDERQLKQVEETFEACFSKIVKIANSGKSKRAVYHCGIQFFRLTKKKEIAR